MAGMNARLAASTRKAGCLARATQASRAQNTAIRRMNSAVLCGSIYLSAPGQDSLTAGGGAAPRAATAHGSAHRPTAHGGGELRPRGPGPHSLADVSVPARTHVIGLSGVPLRRPRAVRHPRRAARHGPTGLHQTLTPRPG